MTPQELQRLRLLLASGAPIDAASLFPGVTQRDVAEALSGVDVCFRDYGMGDSMVVRSLDEPDENGFTSLVDVAATVQIRDRAGDIVRVRGGRKPEKIWDPMNGDQEVVPGGFRTQNFQRAGGPLLWAHNREEQLPPVGAVTKSKVGKVTVPEDMGGGRADAVIQTFGVRPDEDLPISLTIARLVALGALRTVSVGFARVHADFVKDPKARKRKGLDPAGLGIIFVTSDQAELSLTPTPMNPLAVTLGVKAAAEDLVARDVEKGLRTLQKKGLLTRAEHDELHGLLLPMSGDARAEAKLGGFVEFGSTVRSTGLWPVFDDATPEEREEAAAAVAVRPVEEERAAPEAELAPGEEFTQMAEVTPEEIREATAAVRQAGEAEEAGEAIDPATDELEEQVEGLQRQLDAERAVSAGLREELASARQEIVAAEQRAQEARTAGGALSAAEFELLWAAYETVAGVEGTIGQLVESLGARSAGTSERGLDGAPGAGTVTGDVAALIRSEIQRALQGGDVTAGGAPAPRPGPPRPAPGDHQDVGAEGAAVVRAGRQLLERSHRPVGTP